MQPAWWLDGQYWAQPIVATRMDGGKIRGSEGKLRLLLLEIRVKAASHCLILARVVLESRFIPANASIASLRPFS